MTATSSRVSHSLYFHQARMAMSRAAGTPITSVVTMADSPSVSSSRNQFEMKPSAATAAAV
jgi:hypothetical protein